MKKIIPLILLTPLVTSAQVSLEFTGESPQAIEERSFIGQTLFNLQKQGITTQVLLWSAAVIILITIAVIIIAVHFKHKPQPPNQGQPPRDQV